MTGEVTFRLGVAILAVGVAHGAAQRPSDDNAFPRTKSYGRATIQYEDDRVRAVAIYVTDTPRVNQPEPRGPQCLDQVVADGAERSPTPIANPVDAALTTARGAISLAV